VKSDRTAIKEEENIVIKALKIDHLSSKTSLKEKKDGAQTRNRKRPVHERLSEKSEMQQDESGEGRGAKIGRKKSRRRKKKKNREKIGGG